MNELERTILTDIALRDLRDVGLRKSIGYLSLELLNQALKISIDEICCIAKNSNSKIIIFDESKTCIKSGAVFIYNSEMMKNSISRNKKIINKIKWKPDCVFIINKIAKKWYPVDHYVMTFIRDLYNDDGWKPPEPAQVQMLSEIYNEKTSARHILEPDEKKGPSPV